MSVVCTARASTLGYDIPGQPFIRLGGRREDGGGKWRSLASSPLTYDNRAVASRISVRYQHAIYPIDPDPEPMPASVSVSVSVSVSTYRSFPPSLVVINISPNRQAEPAIPPLLDQLV